MIASTKEAYKLFHEGIIALAKVESDGIRIDTDYLNKAITETQQKIKDIGNKLRESDVFSTWRKRFGDRTNLGSSEQLGEVFFKLLKYPCRKFTATKKPSTDKAAFSNIDHPFVGDYFHWKELSKLEGTALKGILRETIDGYIHPFFNLAGGVTTKRKEVRLVFGPVVRQ